MAINPHHVTSLLNQIPTDHETAPKLRAIAEEYEGYVEAGMSIPDPATGETVTPETLMEVAALVRSRADALDRAMLD